MINIPKVIDLVVKNDMCIGCGLCIYKCPSQALEVQINDYGFLIPEQISSCDSDGECITVCPFNPFPKEEVKTENEIAEIYFDKATKYQEKVGRYVNIYAGYANEFRLNSSSGGIATYIFTELIERGIVDHVFSVKQSTKPGFYYEYSISNNRKELSEAAKTRYFPVTLATVMPEIHKLKGKVAIVGVACFIKAIRLAQHTEPLLKDKIPFLVGIICGGVKSSFFTEYLASKVNIPIENIKKPQFRIKDLNSTAGDYSFGCSSTDDNSKKLIRMGSLGDMWGTGLFKANACDFCDDVTTELADISLGDAWLEPFNKEGKGTNVIVTRSFLADKILQEGITSGKLRIETLPLDKFIFSQQGSFNHRQTGLSVRIKKTEKQNILVPPKRFGNLKTNISFKLVQKQRIKVRRESLQKWKYHPNALSFDKEMAKDLKLLKRVTRISHYHRAIIKRIKKIFN
ncbi:Coenzyme F420 hydrogenase/dehydrogenase, beta subunit C-terminal domain [Lutibacter citreus]|uniref:Coenzyme F420 hydrogenase/dehydrogenase, beta subunit C-terminal domain n=1 Tax=Lutibacter citreus TaxID=2138210 RepID=UPI001C550142|nr:Coenzyme F420 hydrogenase/dehydrogenase, beta subunit C-terminal domain [Lutibacter citreus]